MHDIWTTLFAPPPPEDVAAPFWLLYLALFAVGFVLSVAAEGDALAPVVPHPAARRVVGRYVRPAAALFGAGLVLFGIRVLQIDPLRLAAPIWLLLCLGAVVAYLIWAAGRLREELPAAIAACDHGRSGPYREWPPRGGGDARRSAHRS